MNKFALTGMAKHYKSGYMYDHLNNSFTFYR